MHGREPLYNRRRRCADGEHVFMPAKLHECGASTLGGKKLGEEPRQTWRRCGQKEEVYQGAGVAAELLWRGRYRLPPGHVPELLIVWHWPGFSFQHMALARPSIIWLWPGMTASPVWCPSVWWQTPKGCWPWLTQCYLPSEQCFDPSLLRVRLQRQPCCVLSCPLNSDSPFSWTSYALLTFLYRVHSFVNSSSPLHPSSCFYHFLSLFHFFKYSGCCLFRFSCRNGLISFLDDG